MLNKNVFQEFYKEIITELFHFVFIKVTLEFETSRNYKSVLSIFFHNEYAGQGTI